MLRRNRSSFRRSLGFPINVASVLEVEGKDEKIRTQKSISNRRKRQSLKFITCEFFNIFSKEYLRVSCSFLVFTCILYQMLDVYRRREPNTIYASFCIQTFSVLFVGSSLMDRSGTSTDAEFCFDLWLMCFRVRSARPSRRNGPFRCMRSLSQPRWRPTCLTWTASCPTSPTPCSP